MTNSEQAESKPQAEEEENLEQVVEQAEVAEGIEEPGAEEAPDELEQLREELEKASAQAEEYLDGWQRAQAEFSNFKKRQEAERSQTIALANAALLRKVLPIADDFERAVAALPDSSEQEAWLEGFLLIKHNLDAILESEGVALIESEGRTFDPRYHEAVTYEQIEGYEEGQIIGEVRQGYMLGERVLQPALVRVAKAPAIQPDEDSDIAENKE